MTSHDGWGRVSGGAGDVEQLRWHRTTLDGAVACYGDAGDGPVVVLLHGWGLEARAYAATIRVLAGSGHRVVAPALPGFGASDPLEGPLTWERLAWWTHQLLDHAGVHAPADLVGHSFGGGVATAVAWHHPEQVRSLTLVNAVGGGVWRQPADADATHLADRPVWDWGIRFPLEFLRADYRRVLPVVVRDFVGNALRNPRALRAAGRLARTADLRGELEELAARGLPTTILWGDQDRVVPEAAFLATCAAAGADGDVISGADHSWLLADPTTFGEVLTNSLAVRDQVDRTGS